MASASADVLTLRAQWTRLLVREQLARELNISLPPGQTPPTRNKLPTLSEVWPGHGNDNIQNGRREYKLCAGITGLYIALILDTLKIDTLSFDFFEASDRMGGRCFTYEFSKVPHDYYDVGAMRFPKIEVMERTFELFKRTGTHTIPYYLSDDAVNCPNALCGVSSPRILPKGTPIHSKPLAFPMCKPPSSIPPQFMSSFCIVDALNEDPTTGFEKLMTVDHYTTRGYLSQQTKYNGYRGIEYLETFAGSTTSFNGAFSEYVIDSIEFAADKWVCIEGGLDVLTKNVWKELHTKPQLNKRVTRIATAEEEPTAESTTESMRTAIRGLTYGPSTKVAIKFSRPWWITDCGITASVGSTDELLCTCVYPSYNLHDGDHSPAVLLCSYSWRQDALRIGSLVRPDSRHGEDELRELLLRGLAPLYVTHHAWNWHQDPNTMGAFAAFGPAEFSTLYPYLVRPAAGGLLHFAGEATSAHHAWIVGALQSGYRAVSASLQRFGMWEAQRKLREELEGALFQEGGPGWKRKGAEDASGIKGFPIRVPPVACT